MQLISGVGYALKDIESKLGPERFKQFQEFMQGRLMFSPKGLKQQAVYARDYLNFLEPSAISDQQSAKPKPE